jgi:hypothetical protein
MALSLLFTGHMVDLPDRTEPRFPASLETSAHINISKAISLYARNGGSNSRHPVLTNITGFASCARGGDIIFHEECRRLEIATQIVLPFEPSEFVKSSVAGIPGSNWEARFWAVWNLADPDKKHVLGLTASDDAYGICNSHLLELAHQHGRVHLIALWDGKGGEGPGGTADLVEKAARMGDELTIISPQDLQL